MPSIRLEHRVLRSADEDQLLGTSDRQGLQHHGIEHAEDRGCGANAERQREDAGRGETGGPPQAARGVSPVQPQAFDDRLPADIADAILDRVGDAELHPRRARRGFPGHAASHPLFDRPIEEVAEFGVELLLGARPS